MYATTARLVDRLSSGTYDADVLGWASPVPFFGRLEHATVATIGINPSNREFVDSTGSELGEADRRLPTLASLGIEAWSAASASDVRRIARSCHGYFEANPYRLWFDVLDRMLRFGGASYYSDSFACHLDLVPFATSVKWGALNKGTTRALVIEGVRTMAELLRDSSIGLIILNGRAVVSAFEALAETTLKASDVGDWTLPRKQGRGVQGSSYTGSIRSMAGVDFDHTIRVFGYNHNLQSSFGVTNQVVRRIGARVGEEIARYQTR